MTVFGVMIEYLMDHLNMLCEKSTFATSLLMMVLPIILAMYKRICGPVDHSKISLAEIKQI